MNHQMCSTMSFVLLIVTSVKTDFAYRNAKLMNTNVYKFCEVNTYAQSVKGNYMACKRCEISTFIKDNGVDLLFVTETWLSAQGDKAKTAELAPSGFDMKSWWWCGGGGVDPIPCVSTHRITDPRSGPAQLLPPTCQAAQLPPRGPSTNPRPLV